MNKCWKCLVTLEERDPSVTVKVRSTVTITRKMRGRTFHRIVPFESTQWFCEGCYVEVPITVTVQGKS